MSAGDYGDSRWCVVVPGNKRLYLMADTVEERHGTLIFKGHSHETQTPMVVYAFAPGSWKSCYAASMLDGEPIVID